MLYRVTFQTNGVQILLLPRDAKKRKSCPAKLAKQSPFSEAGLWFVRRDANDT
jgi:hypothetical protein